MLGVSPEVNYLGKSLGDYLGGLLCASTSLPDDTAD